MVKTNNAVRIVSSTTFAAKNMRDPANFHGLLWGIHYLATPGSKMIIIGELFTVVGGLAVTPCDNEHNKILSLLDLCSITFFSN